MIYIYIYCFFNGNLQIFTVYRTLKNRILHSSVGYPNGILPQTGWDHELLEATYGESKVESGTAGGGELKGYWMEHMLCKSMLN